MTTWVIDLLAAIGGLVLLYFLWGVIWAVLYALGYTIFQVRVTRTEAIKARPFAFAKWVVFIWPWRGFVEGLFVPCSAITCGGLRWEPPFKYSGFKDAD